MQAWPASQQSALRDQWGVGFSLGHLWAWLDDATMAFLGWITKCLLMLPDLIIHECVSGFGAEVLENCLNCDEDLYEVASIVFGPPEMGVPVQRDRRYTLCWLRSDQVAW